MKALKNAIKSGLKAIGLEVRRTGKHGYKDLLAYEADGDFNQLYNSGMALTRTPDTGHKRRSRFYNLMQLHLYVRELDGKTAECGCWKGLSSHLLCSYEKKFSPSYKGGSHEIYDSFSGLSEPTKDDQINDSGIKSIFGAIGGQPGDYSENVEAVKRNLQEFGEIQFYKGWIPQSFASTNANKYKFVHVDVDLYDPTLDSLKFFYPRLVPGGVIVCDDYGSLLWPGAKKAVEEFCKDMKIKLIALSTGQAVIFKHG